MRVSLPSRQHSSCLLPNLIKEERGHLDARLLKLIIYLILIVKSPSNIMLKSVLVALLFWCSVASTDGFSARAKRVRPCTWTTGDSSRPYAMSTVAPSREDVETERRTGRDKDDDFLGDKDENFEDAIRKQGPLEWLEDAVESREMDDPYHILLLGQTFEKPKITVPYVAGSLNYVLDMPLDEASELSQFSHDHGISCLGTWRREECLRLGRELQVRDIVCRVVPYCDGGQRGWQAKDAGDFSSLRDASYSE